MKHGILFRENRAKLALQALEISKDSADVWVALNFNKNVPLYILGKKRLSRILLEYIILKDETEAIAYVVEAGGAWRKTEGAIEWLATTVNL